MKLKIGSGDVGKAALFTLGMGLISTGAGFLSSANIVAGVACVGCGFGCILLGIWWTENQAAQIALNKMLKPTN